MNQGEILIFSFINQINISNFTAHASFVVFVPNVKLLYVDPGAGYIGQQIFDIMNQDETRLVLLVKQILRILLLQCLL
jgi:hypothetical protein